jgi:hypothetical protein
MSKCIESSFTGGLALEIDARRLHSLNDFVYMLAQNEDGSENNIKEIGFESSF